jgi:hypothetical protein
MNASNPLRSTLALTCLLLAASPLARAVDLIPFGGLRFGGSFSSAGSDVPYSSSYSISASGSYGGIIDLPLGNSPRAVEVYYSRQDTTLSGGQTLNPPIHDLSVNVLHLGLVDSIPGDDPRLSWLLIGSAGATWVEAAGADETRPSIGLGGGVRWMANEHFGVRADLRALLTFNGGGGGAIACGGGCNLSFHGSVAAQGEASIGLVARF